MGLVVTYYSPTTPGVSSWSEDLSGAVRLGTIAGLIDDAELGTVGISSLLFDDPLGTLGHAGDAIKGLKQLYIDETAAPAGNQRLWTGYIADRRYHRGTDSLITGVARKIDATLVDVNSFLSFRIFAPTAMDATSDFVRPAETDIARVGALLTTVDFLSTTLFDDGLVASTGGIAMDACDYTGQHPADVLNDCSQASGRNHFAQYNEATGHYQLFYDFDHSAVYSSSLQISNVLADVDGVTTFAPEPDAELKRDPSRIGAAGYMPFSGSNSPAYRTRPANASNYAWRDVSAPSANVKTLAKANARLDRYLLDSVPEDDRITCTVKLPREKVTGIKAGHRVQAKFSHLPNGSNSTWGSAFQWCRVLNRTVMANEQTNTLYNMRLELSPLVGSSTSASWFIGASIGGYPDGSTTIWASDDGVAFHQVLSNADLVAAGSGAAASISSGEADHHYWSVHYDYTKPSGGYYAGTMYLGFKLLPAKFVGYQGQTSGGAPTTGTWALGDWFICTTSPPLWLCTVAGTPGTWVDASTSDLFYNVPWASTVSYTDSPVTLYDNGVTVLDPRPGASFGVNAGVINAEILGATWTIQL